MAERGDHDAIIHSQMSERNVGVPFKRHCFTTEGRVVGFEKRAICCCRDRRPEASTTTREVVIKEVDVYRYQLDQVKYVEGSYRFASYHETIIDRVELIELISKLSEPFSLCFTSKCETGFTLV
jgi:hypothetical protein